MTHLTTLQSISDELEALVDRHGLYTVTEALALMCSAKADHVASAWQDEAGGKRWDRAAAKFLQTEQALRKIQGL
jgi:hypothetical protein